MYASHVGLERKWTFWWFSFIEAKYVNHVRTKTENVSQNESVQSCHHGANLSPCPKLHQLCQKGKEMVPCMQCNTVYICFIPKLPSLSYSLSMAEGAADCRLQEGRVSECSLTNDNIYNGKKKKKIPWDSTKHSDWHIVNVIMLFSLVYRVLTFLCECQWYVSACENLKQKNCCL